MRSPRSFYLRVGCGYVVEGNSRVNKKNRAMRERKMLRPRNQFFFKRAKKGLVRIEEEDERG